MRKVRSTITMVDLLEKRRVIDAENVKKKKENEQLDKSALELRGQVADFSEKLKKLNEDFESVLDNLDDTYELQKKEYATSANILTDAFSLVKSTLDLLSFLDKRVVEENKKLEDVVKKQEEVKKSINREQEALSERKKDLDIYKNRLQKYIDESGAPIKLRL